MMRERRNSLARYLGAGIYKLLVLIDFDNLYDA